MFQWDTRALEILDALEQAGHQAVLVGGCVRDALLGRTPEDWDVTTAARPEETMALFGDRAVPTGLRHGTVTVRTAVGGVEVTTLRRDGTYRDHRRPESVTFTDSLEEDLRRRDFTVNALAVDLHGTLRDPLGGRADLAAGGPPGATPPRPLCRWPWRASRRWPACPCSATSCTLGMT